jgi:flagellar biosynthetic protein FlhB
LFSPEKIKPDLKKLSPLAGWKRLFGVDRPGSVAKSTVKLIAIAVVVWMTFKPHARELETLVALQPAALLPLARDMLISMSSPCWSPAGAGRRVRLVLAASPLDDAHEDEPEEVKEDYKSTEGDPHVKAKLKQIRLEKSRQRMRQNVPTATVVVMNPTHYAVALKYEPGEMAAPCAWPRAWTPWRCASATWRARAEWR